MAKEYKLSYTATEIDKKLGMVPNPVTKSDNMFQPVGMDEFGGLWTVGSETYYSNLSTAITDINNGVTTNALSSATNAKVKVFTSHTGALAVMLLDDVSESVAITVNKDIDLSLNGHVLNLTTASATLTFEAGTNCKIYGLVDGSSIIMDGINATAVTRMIRASGDSFEIHGGSYTMNLNSSYQTNILSIASTCGKCEVYDAVMSVSNIGDGMSCVVSGSTINGLVLKNVIANTMAKTAAYAVSITNGSIELENSTLTARSDTSFAIACYVYAGHSKIKDSTLNAVVNLKTAYALFVKASDSINKVYAENTRFFADAPDCHADSNSDSRAVAISNNGELHLTNCIAFGTHSAVSSNAKLYVNGGTYTGFCHGGFYIGSNSTEVFINDATLRSNNYEGEFDYSDMAADVYASMYIGSGNNLTAYLDGCTVENNGHRPIVLRGTDGEQNNTLNISNSTVDGIIRSDNETLRVNVGVGTNITESTFDDASRATWTSELYRKNPVDKALNNNDFEALKKYIEPQYELIETVEITAENTAAVVMKHKLDKFALYIKTPVADAALSCGVQVSKDSTIVGYAWLDGMVGTEARRCTVFGRNENGISYIENTKPQKLTDAIESTMTLLKQSRLAEGNTSYTQIRVFGSGGNAMPIGTTFELWGVKA